MHLLLGELFHFYTNLENIGVVIVLNGNHLFSVIFITKTTTYLTRYFRGFLYSTGTVLHVRPCVYIYRHVCICIRVYVCELSGWIECMGTLNKEKRRTRWGRRARREWELSRTGFDWAAGWSILKDSPHRLDQERPTYSCMHVLLRSTLLFVLPTFERRTFTVFLLTLLLTHPPEAATSLLRLVVIACYVNRRFYIRILFGSKFD